MSLNSDKSDIKADIIMDRLTTLVERFHLTVQEVPLHLANLVVCADASGHPKHVLFFTDGQLAGTGHDLVLLSAFVDWSGATNPLLTALPDVALFDLMTHGDSRMLVQLMIDETLGNRCGAQSVINRLGEALMVRLLRDQIERGATKASLLAGMADPRLSRAIVSIHDHPGRVWTNADLADVAGLSLSRFNELFAQHVGETPMGYLRRWRLILARQDLQRGDRIDAVARRYAYGSPESFSRAFRQSYGESPSAVRPRKAVTARTH